MSEQRSPLEEKIVEYRKVWNTLKTDQKVSLTTMLALLVALPLATLATLSYKTFFSRAGFPATPPTTPPATSPITPIPTPTKSPVKWTTDTVYLSADDFGIDANNMRFDAYGEKVDVHSDPGSPTYTSLEITWYENGVEMRMFMYFRSDGTNWWVDEMRTYDGTAEPDWIYYRYNVIPPTPLGVPFTGWFSHGIGEARSQIYFNNLYLAPFRNRFPPIITPTFTPTPSPVVTPPVGNVAPRIQTPMVKVARRGKQFSGKIFARDRNADPMTMKFESLPEGLTMTQCEEELLKNGSSEIACTIEGIPVKRGRHQIGVSVEDVWGARDSRIIHLFVF